MGCRSTFHLVVSNYRHAYPYPLYLGCIFERGLLYRRMEARRSSTIIDGVSLFVGPPEWERKGRTIGQRHVLSLLIILNYYMDDDWTGVGKTTVTSGTRRHANMVQFSETGKCIYRSIFHLSEYHFFSRPIGLRKYTVEQQSPLRSDVNCF